MLDDKLWSSVWAPDPLTAAVDSVGLVTIGVLALTERFSSVPAAVVAFAAAHVITSVGTPRRRQPASCSVAGSISGTP